MLPLPFALIRYVNSTSACVNIFLALLFIFNVSLALKYQASSVSSLRSPPRFSIVVTAVNVKLHVLQRSNHGAGTWRELNVVNWREDTCSNNPCPPRRGPLGISMRNKIPWMPDPGSHSYDHGLDWIHMASWEKKSNGIARCDFSIPSGWLDVSRPRDSLASSFAFLLDMWCIFCSFIDASWGNHNSIMANYLPALRLSGAH